MQGPSKGFGRPVLAMALLALVGGMGGHASATAFCEVKRTSDGFVALRDTPSVKASRIWRLKAGEMVQLDRTRSSPKGWVAVIYRSEDRKTERFGWVAERLIEQECG